MRTGIKAVVGALICVSAVAIWFVVPKFAAAGLALDHPAFADPDDPAIGSVEKAESWFPPGTRYEWIGAASGQRRVEVDPWGASISSAILWTVLCAGAAGFAVRFTVRT